MLWDSLGRMGTTLGFPTLGGEGFPTSHSLPQPQTPPRHLLPCASGGAVALHSLPSAQDVISFHLALAAGWTFIGAAAQPQGSEGTASLEENIFRVP